MVSTCNVFDLLRNPNLRGHRCIIFIVICELSANIVFNLQWMAIELQFDQSFVFTTYQEIVDKQIVLLWGFYIFIFLRLLDILDVIN